MERFYLEVPCPERKEEAIAYIKEFQEYGSQINGAGGLNHYLEDYEGWLLSEEAYNLYAPCMYEPTYGKYNEMMTSLLQSQEVEIYVYRTEHYVTGMLVLEVKDASAEITGIAVDSGCRHFGIGRKLVKQAMESGRITKLYAETDEDGVGFYRGCGFTVEAVMKHYPNGAVTRYSCVLQNESQGINE